MNIKFFKNFFLGARHLYLKTKYAVPVNLYQGPHMPAVFAVAVTLRTIRANIPVAGEASGLLDFSVDHATDLAVMGNGNVLSTKRTDKSS